MKMSDGELSDGVGDWKDRFKTEVIYLELLMNNIRRFNRPQD